jgi:hypothetical protein
MAQLHIQSPQQAGTKDQGAEQLPKLRPNISKVQPSALLARLQNFLPQMELANSSLPIGEMAESGSKTICDTADPLIMSVRDDGDASDDGNDSCGADEPHVEMVSCCRENAALVFLHQNSFG